MAFDGAVDFLEAAVNVPSGQVLWGSVVAGYVLIARMLFYLRVVQLKQSTGL